MRTGCIMPLVPDCWIPLNIASDSRLPELTGVLVGAAQVDSKRSMVTVVLSAYSIHSLYLRESTAVAIPGVW